MTRKLIIGTALVLTIFFGLFRQIKVISQSGEEIFDSNEEAGRSAFLLKQEFQKNFLSSRSQKPIISYRTDRRNEDAERAASEFYYDVQYGFAPFLVVPGYKDTNYCLFDYVSEAKLTECLLKEGAVVLARRGSLVLCYAGTRKDPDV